MKPSLRPILILGPTAGRKSEAAVQLAERVATIDGQPGGIISADSMQIYRRMNAGTAKPSLALRQRAAHHLIDIVEPTERFTVAHWLERADALIEAWRARGIRPIIVGGTNLYIRALLEGLFAGPPADAAFRELLQTCDSRELHVRLTRVDPVAAARMAINDRRRIIRALEVHHLTGRPISDWQEQWRDESEQTYRHDPILIGLHWSAEQINPRINLRVKAMFYPQQVDPDLAREVCPDGCSLPEEVRELQAAGLLGPQAREALGYKQVLAHLAGQCSLEEAFEQTKIQTRRFARQQRTWLRRFRGVHWLPAAEVPVQELIEKILTIILGQ